ncbi:hypothetical protein C6497_06165 [Candidatus Poribacteria bacterium]|nr:MAG: hypothetical protein C6497_06165 [Candidatus Poribacteria bacterium]
MNTISDKITLTLNNDTKVSLKGYIAPIEYTQYNFHVEWDVLSNLRVAEPVKQYPTSVFMVFLPSKSISVGECWQIKDGVVDILRQLHTNPTLNLDCNNGDSLGLWACLRAYNDEYADIVFRIHAEFTLKGGRFTPSQFTGHLVINRSKKSIASFNMYVPNGTLNFDAYQNDVGSEIGYCPKIELRSDIPFQDTEYTTSITQEEAERILILRFYNFVKINWVSLEEAHEMAIAQHKPIHAVALDGPLTDESC